MLHKTSFSFNMLLWIHCTHQLCLVFFIALVIQSLHFSLQSWSPACIIYHSPRGIYSSRKLPESRRNHKAKSGIWGSNWNCVKYSKNVQSSGIFLFPQEKVLLCEEACFLMRKCASSWGILLPYEESCFLMRNPASSWGNVLSCEKPASSRGLFFFRVKRVLPRGRKFPHGEACFLTWKFFSSLRNLLPQEEACYLGRKHAFSGESMFL